MTEDNMNGGMPYQPDGNAGQYGQQQYAGQYGQQQYAGQYGQQQNAGQYGQQQYAGQYGQQQYTDRYSQGMQNGQQSVYEQTMNVYGDQSYKQESPKKRKGIRIALICVVALLVVAAAAAAVYFLFIRKTPKEAVQDACENTFAELENNSLADIVGESEFDAENLSYDMEMTLDNLAGLDVFKGITIGLNGATSGANSEYGGSLSYNGEAVSIIVSVVDNVAYISSPELLENPLKCDIQKIIDELGDAAAGQGGTVDSDALAKLVEEKLDPATETLKESIIYEIIGKEEFTNTNGAAVKATKYTVTITSEAIEAYADAVEEFLEEYADSNLSDSMLSEMGVSRNEIDQVLTMIPKAITSVMDDDVVVNVYVSDKKLVRIDTEYELGLLGMTINYSSDFMGEDRVTSDMATKLTANYGSYFDAVLDCRSTNTVSGDETSSKTDYTVGLSAYGETVNVTGKSNFSYNSSTGAMGYEISGGSDEIGQGKVSFSGTLTDVEKGKSYTLNDAKISVTYDGDEMFAMSGKISVAENTEGISAPSGAIDYTDISDIESNPEKYINVDKATDIAEAWSSLFGTDFADSDYFTSDDSDDDDYDDVYDDDYDDLQSADYSKEVIVMGDRKVKINDPAGLERSYGSSISISLSSSDGSEYAYYTAWENSTTDEIKEYNEVDYSAEDDVTVNMQKGGTFKASDGTEVEYTVTNVTMYAGTTNNTYFNMYYQTKDGVVTCTVQLWDNDGDIDVEKLGKKYMDAIEIE